MIGYCSLYALACHYFNHGGHCAMQPQQPQQHSAAEHIAAEHGTGTHGLARHGAAEHSAGAHLAATHGAAEHGAAGHLAAEHIIAEHAAAIRGGAECAAAGSSRRAERRMKLGAHRLERRVRDDERREVRQPCLAPRTAARLRSRRR